MGINPNQNPNPNQPGYGGYTPQQPIPPYVSPPTNQPGGYYPPPDPNTYAAGQQQQQQQQQQTYQTGSSYDYAAPISEAYDVTSTRMSARNEAVLSYLLLWFSGLVMFFVERKNRFVRFHAAQSFLFCGAVFVVYVVLRLLTLVPLVGFLLSPILAVLLWVLVIPATLIWLFLMFQAYRGVTFKLPIFGELADGWVNRFTKKKKVV